MLSKKIVSYVSLFLVTVLALVMLFSTMALEATAVAVTGVSGVEVTVDGNGSISESSGTVTVTAKGSFTSAKTATITVTNTSGSTANISFDYSGTQVGGCSLGGVSSNKCSGTKTVLLTAGATTTFTITSRSWTSSTTVTMKLSNFKVEAVAAESKVTVTYGNLGSVKIDGTTVASGSENSVSSASGASFVAVPGSGSKFVAWINPTTNDVISTSATYQLIPTEAMTIRAVFAKASEAPVFFANGTAKVFESLDAAISYASSASNKTITLASDGTLAAGNYTIPAGITLLIPFDNNNTLFTNTPNVDENAYTKPSVFRTLTMASGAKVTVNGAISISAHLSSKKGYNGMTSGKYGLIEMKSGSTITVNNGAKLYVWGYIKGSGSVTVNSGGEVFECFQIADYRGGDATSTIVGEDDTYGVFPFNQYYIQNVEVPMTMHAGSIENGYGSVYVTVAGVQKLNVPFFGASDSMFNITSGYVVKDYMENTGRISIEVHGDLTIQEVTLNMKVGLLGSLDIDTSKYALPIPNHMTIRLLSGNLNLNQNMAFLPGSELYVQDGTKVTLGAGKKLYIYDWDEWTYNDGANGYSATSNVPYVKLPYVPGGNGTTGREKDALVEINGEIDASAGSVYVTEGGANIYSTGTGVIKVGNVSDSVAYQVITSGSDISSWPAITMKPAILLDNDGTMVSTNEVSGTYTYYATTGKWCTPGHRYKSTVTPPTCTEDGYTTHTCVACGDSRSEDPVYSLGHTEVIDAAKAPTCTATGLTEGKHCSVCGEVIVAQKTVDALGHSYNAVVTKPTCTDKGYTTHTCSTCGDSYKDSYVNALGHSIGDNYVCEVCNLFQFLGSNVFLGNNLDMWFAFPKAAVTGDLTGYYALVMQDGEETRIDYTAENPWQVETVGGVECYIIIYDGIAAKEMSDLIEVTVYNAAGEPVSSVKKDSIRDYAVRIMKKYPNNELLKYLIVDMLQYGAACQTRFGYKPDDLATSVLSGITDDEGNTYEAPSNVGEISNIYIQAANVITTSAVQFAVLLTDSPAVETATYTFLDHWGNKVEGNLEYDVEEKYYYIPGLVIADAASEITIIINGDADNAYKDSMKNYCDRMINKNSEDADVFEAFMAFSMSAKKYLEEGRGDVE